MTETTIEISFNMPLDITEVPHFRGAVLDSIKIGKDVLMHNHLDESLRYAYPMVQYKSIDGKASILCIDKGVDVCGSLMQVCNQSIAIGRSKHRQRLIVEKMVPGQTEVQIGESLRYHIDNWVPFNERNYDEYFALTTDDERIAFLQRMLVGNILSFAKGIGLFFDQRVECTICSFRQLRTSTYKRIEMATFDVDFLCNVRLPEHIGLGKHTSVGYGVISIIDK